MLRACEMIPGPSSADEMGPQALESRTSEPIWLIGLAALTLACAPRITPQGVKVVGVNNSGVDFELHLVASNPGGAELHTGAVAAKVMMGNERLGPVAGTPHDQIVPAHGEATLEVPLRIAWDNGAMFFDLGSAAQDVAFTVDGLVVTIPNNGKLPFRASGVIPGKELEQAMRNFATTFTDD
jgi:hypothetical protein